MNGGAPLRSICIAGGGAVALTAACAFARVLPRAAITLVATPVDPAAFADRFSTMWAFGAPPLARFGLDDRALAAGGGAAPVLACKFADWSRDGTPWLVANDAAVTVPGSGALHQRWLDAARGGASLPFHALFPAAALAQAGATSIPDHVEHALSFDSTMLVHRLGEHARRAGVRLVTGAITAVDRNDRQGVREIRLADGERHSADLFVDATGPAALLMEDADRIDWSAALPCDRLLTLAEDAAPPSFVDHYRATDVGWTAQWQRPGGVIHAVGYSDATSTEQRARRLLARGRDDATLIAVRPGRLTKGWRDNLLALGEASVQPGPLGCGGYTLSLAQLDLALDLLPDRHMEPLLIDEFNRRAGLRADRMRDYLAAFYFSGGRQRGPFWQALAGARPPADLATTLLQFGQRGSLPHHDEESATPDAWRAVLLGQGIRPRRRDPIAAAADQDESAAMLNDIGAKLKAAAERVARA